MTGSGVRKRIRPEPGKQRLRVVSEQHQLKLRLETSLVASHILVPLSSAGTPIPMSDSTGDSHQNEQDEDAELAALMTSALDDFERQKSVPQPGRQEPELGTSDRASPSLYSDVSHGQLPFDPAMMREVDDIFKNMMGQDPVLKDHWEKLAESCSRAGACPDCPALMCLTDGVSYSRRRWGRRVREISTGDS